ncbi:MAG TPA: hypothetical protein VG253_27950 [Streptosporangiaceae bacterium]|jgi:hypothetical protein|nr:hypothetical protein [Streptosporangiaceae bacterium]
MSLRTRKQDAKSKARAAQASAKAAQASAKAAKTSAKAGATKIQGHARQATAQFTPFAQTARTTMQSAGKSAREGAQTTAQGARKTAQRGLFGARVWAAPRVERSGQVLTERVAPKVSDMLTATAKRMEPPKARRRRRLPGVIAGLFVLGAAAGAAVALLRSQRGMAGAGSGSGSPADTSPDNGTPSTPAAPDLAEADANGQVRTH